MLINIVVGNYSPSLASLARTLFIAKQCSFNSSLSNLPSYLIPHVHFMYVIISFRYQILDAQILNLFQRLQIGEEYVYT